MQREKQRYEKRRKFHSDISTYHQKNPRNQKSCGKRGLACYTGEYTETGNSRPDSISLVDHSSFRTEPRWQGDPACYCSNATNGTFFCIRGINDTCKYSIINSI